MDSQFCVNCLQEPISKHGTPDMFNTDQGEQFTTEVFISELKKHPEIRISMDGRGRALDNVFVERLWRSVKHEDLYLKGYATGAELQPGLKAYYTFLTQNVCIRLLAIKPPASSMQLRVVAELKT